MTASNCPSLAKKRCIVRDANFEKLDQACHVWFLQQHSNSAPLSGPLLREKALQLTPYKLLIWLILMIFSTSKFPVKNWRDLAAQCQVLAAKQTKITSLCT